MDETRNLGSNLIRTLETAYAAVRNNHPELPADVLFITGSGRQGRKMRLGHFCATRWTQVNAEALDNIEGKLPPEKPYVAEIFVSGEAIAAGAEEVLTTLLHESAHALAHVREIKDTTPPSHRYHNKKFLALAEELGLELLEKSSSLGFSDVWMPVPLRDKYHYTLDRLKEDLAAHIPLSLLGGRKSPNRNLHKATCLCEPERIVRVSPKVLNQDPIRCGLCEAEFAYRG